MGCCFIANIKITDEITYKEYLDSCDGVFKKFNGTYIAVDSNPLVLEGDWKYSRIVMIHFETEEDFRSWYYSPEYQQILRCRLEGAHCDTLLVHERDTETKVLR
jgi:uncharacterized protein (DUF1330 family)